MIGLNLKNCCLVKIDGKASLLVVGCITNIIAGAFARAFYQLSNINVEWLRKVQSNKACGEK